MRSGTKDKRYSFITVVSVYFFLSAFVLAIPVYAAGEIVAWGGNGYGQCTVPSPNAGFTAITAGFGHSLGLKGCLFALAGDMNNDCMVDLSDIAMLAGNWLVNCFEIPSNPSCVPR